MEAGARVLPEALPPEVLANLERDVETVIEAFDGGYETPARPGSLTSGARQEHTFLHAGLQLGTLMLNSCGHPPIPLC